MLRVEHSLEVSNYFLDNGKLIFELMVAIEGLVFTNGIPNQGVHIEMDRGRHVWQLMGHVVVYRIEEQRLIVEVIIPD